MTYAISTPKGHNYIVVKVIGEVTRLQALSMNEESHRIARERGVSRILMDMVEARNIESKIENYFFAYEDMKQSAVIDKRIRVAMLVDPTDHSHDFIETVSRNSGLNFSLFTSRPLAEDHLR
jgi:hypothetical protein